MAEMIPEKLPASRTEGEQRVFNILSKLPDDCLVYYEPILRRRYPDFIVILPKLGVLIVEVKDWYLSRLTNVTSTSVTLNPPDGSKVVDHPS